jgi:hypothetical protein
MKLEELKEKIADYVEGIRTPIGCPESPIGLCFEHRPIQLADVLLAIEKTFKENWGKYVELGTIENGKLLFCWDKETDNEYAYWNLSTDLDGQSEEVKEFLYKIII